MEKDHNHIQKTGMCIPIAWSPLDAYRREASIMPTLCPRGRKNYDEILKQSEEIKRILSKKK